MEKIRALEFNKIFVAFGADVRSLNFDERSHYSNVSMVLGGGSGSSSLDFSSKERGRRADNPQKW